MCFLQTVSSHSSLKQKANVLKRCYLSAWIVDCHFSLYGFIVTWLLFYMVLIIIFSLFRHPKISNNTPFFFLAFVLHVQQQKKKMLCASKITEKQVQKNQVKHIYLNVQPWWRVKIDQIESMATITPPRKVSGVSSLPINMETNKK